MQIRQNNIGICGGLFLAIPDLKLKTWMKLVSKIQVTVVIKELE